LVNAPARLTRRPERENGTSVRIARFPVLKDDLKNAVTLPPVFYAGRGE
jgi:hypothetical protein